MVRYSVQSKDWYNKISSSLLVIAYVNVRLKGFIYEKGSYHFHLIRVVGNL